MEPIAEPELTKRQIASRENGAKSKGPITEEGKAKSSLNSLKHGLCSTQELLMEGENEEALAALRTATYGEYDPQTATEILLVERIAAYFWRLRRVYSKEKGISQRENNENAAVLLSRYETSLERGLDRTIKLLQQLISNRLKSSKFRNNPEESFWREIIEAPVPPTRETRRDKLLDLVALKSKKPRAGSPGHPRQKATVA